MSGTVVVFCFFGIGHLHCLLPVIEHLRARDRTVHVLTRPSLETAVQRAGVQFIDLFDGYPPDAADATSQPIPSRGVSFAGTYAEPLARDVAALSPDLIVYDTYSVIAPVVARLLDVPYVNVCPNHAGVPARLAAALREDPRVATSAECWAAVRRLREVHGMRDANPFSYVEAVSPYLNLYPEPAEFLDEADRAAFDPLAFFGALAPAMREDAAAPAFPASRERRKLFVSFGTIVWNYFEAQALAALRAISASCETLDIDVVVGLGGWSLPAGTAKSLARANVRVVDFVNQWAVLGEADLFLTHHGINSTHEAIYHEVPMLSYPFFADQPPLARRCQELGLAVPIAEEPLGEVTADALAAALARLDADAAGFAARLAEARSWELRTMSARDETVDRMLALAGHRTASDASSSAL